MLLTTSCVTHCTSSGESVSSTSKTDRPLADFVSNCAVSSMEMSNDIPSAFNRVVSRSYSSLKKTSVKIRRKQKILVLFVRIILRSSTYFLTGSYLQFPFPRACHSRVQIQDTHNTLFSRRGETHLPKTKMFQTLIQ